jgi:hypothetical protein
LIKKYSFKDFLIDFSHPSFNILLGPHESEDVFFVNERFALISMRVAL